MRLPICEVCRDTHKMALYDRQVSCTHCPLPCDRCGSKGGCGCFCSVTPCACDCHKDDWRYKKAQSHFGPPGLVVGKAIEAANSSPCAKSKRGVVLFTLRSNGALDIHAAKHNSPPWPYECSGTDACKKDCGRVAVHAEQRAIIEGLRRVEHRLQIDSSDYPWSDLADDHGRLQVVHVKTVDSLLVGSKGPSCDQCSKLMLDAGVEVVWLYSGSGWDRYDASSFHRITLKNCGLHCHI